MQFTRNVSGRVVEDVRQNHCARCAEHKRWHQQRFINTALVQFVLIRKLVQAPPLYFFKHENRRPNMTIDILQLRFQPPHIPDHSKLCDRMFFHTKPYVFYQYSYLYFRVPRT